ncbi:MAG TPA: diguanylate cyclase [Steroidobacteraceae bacterium]|jgi:diguanylate cyclase (GGDEF)-like protein
MWAFRKSLRRFAIAAALLAAACACPAAERWAGLADAVFQELAHDNELPNAALPTSVAQDRDGFLWIGSQNGLARWDGYHFRNYRSIPGKPGTLPDNFIQTLFSDAHGVLWVGTISGGLARYDREHDLFVSYPVGPRGLSNVSVRAIADDGIGGVWVGTEGGLDHVIPGTAAVAHLRHLEGDPRSLPDNRIRGLMRDRHGTLWVGTASGLARLDSLATGFVPVALPAPEGKLPAAWTFLEDSQGRIWIGTVRQGAYVIESRLSGVARPVQESNPTHSTLQDEGIGAIVEPVPGEIWLGTVGGGIVSVDLATMHTRRIRHDPTLAASLPEDTIQAFYKDRSGLVWICGNRSVSRFDADQSALLTVFGASSRPDTISDTNVDAVLPRPDGRVWVGLDSNGVDILDPAGTRSVGLRPDPSHPDTALPRDFINAFAATASGDVYIATEQGLYRADSAGQRAVRVTVPLRDPVAPVWALLFDGDVLWIGGSDGLWALDLSAHQSLFITHAELSSGLTDQRITSFAREGRFLWVGTKKGLNRLDLKTNGVERILPEASDPRALSASYVTSLLTDARGRLWVATFGGGVDVLESRDEHGRPRFRRLGILQGFVNENANKLLEDLQHNVWVSTDEGLVRINESTFSIRALRRAEGLPISSYWVGSGALTPQGELLFGGVGGLTVVRPDRLTPWSYRPPIVITDIRIGGKPVPAGRLGLDDTAPALTVAPTGNSIAVEFSALDYSAPERNHYAYRLEGFDSGWVDSEATRRLAAYTNLPPGDYRLHLRGSNRDGIWTEGTLSVPVRVLPAWYQTVAFRALVTLLGVGVIVALIQIRTMYLKRSQRDLERQVIERTAELRESQRQLEQIAYYDTLTALPNRRMFTEEFRELIVLARLQTERFALLLIDLDRFKQINDSRGHDAGDALLIEAAIRLQAAVRKSDCVARLGGDEFAVLVAHNPAATDIENICHRIIEGFVLPVPVNGAALRSSASIGVAVFPDHGSTLDNLYKSADLALYEAKRAGGNQWHWYRSQIAGIAAQQNILGVL